MRGTRNPSWGGWAAYIAAHRSLRRDHSSYSGRVGTLSSRCGTLYSVVSLLKCSALFQTTLYPPLSLKHTRRLWCSSTLECSISFSQGNCPFNWHSRSCCVRGFTGCIPLGAAASHYNIFSFVFVFYQTAKLKWHHLHSILWLLLICCTIFWLLWLRKMTEPKLHTSLKTDPVLKTQFYMLQIFCSLMSQIIC